MELTESQIESINSNAPNEYQENEQGVFMQPFGVPNEIKELVIYMRYKTGGMTGGGYHENSRLRRYETETQKPKFSVLDLVLKELKPNITFLQYRDIEDIVRKGNGNDNEDYYGNRSDFNFEYIILSELINLLETF